MFKSNVSYDQCCVVGEVLVALVIPPTGRNPEALLQLIDMQCEPGPLSGPRLLKHIPGVTLKGVQEKYGRGYRNFQHSALVRVPMHVRENSVIEGVEECKSLALKYMAAVRAAAQDIVPFEQSYEAELEKLTAEGIF